jgi:hypothetical protein
MITVNKTAATSKVQEDSQRLFNQISENAQKGIDQTELWFDNVHYDETVTALNKLLGDTDFTYMIVRRGTNSYTGRAEHFTGERVGDQRRRIIKLLS